MIVAAAAAAAARGVCNITHLSTGCNVVPCSDLSRTVKIEQSLNVTTDKSVISFYRAAAMHPRSSYEHCVRPSVRLSVKRVNCDKTKEISADIHNAYTT